MGPVADAMGRFVGRASAVSAFCAPFDQPEKDRTRVSTCANDVYKAPEERATRAGVVRHDWAPTGPATAFVGGDPGGGALDVLAVPAVDCRHDTAGGCGEDSIYWHARPKDVTSVAVSSVTSAKGKRGRRSVTGQDEGRGPGTSSRSCTASLTREPPELAHLPVEQAVAAWLASLDLDPEHSRELHGSWPST